MRKLAVASLSFAVGVLLAHYVIPSVHWNIPAVSAVMIAVLTMICCRGKLRDRVLLICLFVAFGILRYDVQVRVKVDPTEQYVGQVHDITAVVADYPDLYDDYSRITVRLLSDDLPRVKAMFYDYNGVSESLKPGDLINASVKFSSALLSYGESTDTHISKGIYLRGYFKENPVFIGEWQWKCIYTPQRFAQTIRQVLNQYIPERASVFMEALLTGDKTALYEHPEIYNTLTRAGLAHIVAVSGMHVGFLLALMLMMFGNRRGWMIGILAIVLFSIMTGLSPSVMRAVMMQMLYLLAPVLRREPDGVTSISFALLILLLLNPFSIASLSLQLSFASMMGIVLLTPRIMAWFGEKRRPRSVNGKKIYAFLSASISASVGATVFTAPLCALHFGSISVLSPLTNLLVLWIVPYCFAGGLLVCVMSMASGGVAGVLGKLISIMVEFVYIVSKIIASLPFASVYLPSVWMTVWLVFAYGVIIVSYFRKGSALYKPLIPCAVCIISMCAIMLGVMQYYRQGTTVGAVDVGQGQSIVLLNNDDTVLVDCGGVYDSGERTAKWLYQHGRYDVDALFLTHFDDDHVNGVVDLMTQIPVKEIFVSQNVVLANSLYYEELITYADTCGSKVTVLATHTERCMDSIDLKIYVSDKTTDSEGLIVLASVEDFDLLVTGDAGTGTEGKLMKELGVPDGECLIVGHHGSKYSTGARLLDAFQPEFAIISCGYNNYGHPTQEVLDRLNERNVIIYRTDEQGSVELRVR